jgi:CHASE1-domain containing sensor protein
MSERGLLIVNPLWQKWTTSNTQLGTLAFTGALFLVFSVVFLFDQFGRCSRNSLPRTQSVHVEV